MAKVTLRDNCIYADSERLPLLGGEVHYWRVDPRNWSKILDAVKGLGLSLVSSFVIWQYHEYEKGKWDFTGTTHPCRDLVSFIKLVQEKGMWLVLRPGPYGYPEWLNLGIPDWAVPYHRTHPEFHKLAAPYIGEVCKTIKPFLATNGGPVIIVQADNEIEPFVVSYANELGLGAKPGPFHEFLKLKYGSVDALNDAWRSSYNEFTHAGAVISYVDGSDTMLRRHLDYIEFCFHHNRTYAKWVVEQYRKGGVDVPMILNTYPFFGYQDWRDSQAFADIHGIDIYPGNEFRQEPPDHRKFLEKIRFMRSFSKLPYIAEYQSGIAHGLHYSRGTYVANHYWLSCMSALMGGVYGWSWYMLHDRDNWYMSPINEWGRTRPELYKVFKEIVQIFNEIDVPRMVKLSHSAATFNLLHHCAGAVKDSAPVLNALYDADIDYEFFDVDTGAIEKPILFYSGANWQSKKAQRNLLEYVERGGNLIIFNTLPLKDENMRNYNLLAIKEPDRITLSKCVRFELGSEEVELTSPLFDYNTTPGEPIVATQQYKTEFPEVDIVLSEELAHIFNLEQGSQYTIGYVEKKGKGTLMVLGVTPTPALLVALHTYFGIKLPSRSLTPGVQTALFAKGDVHYLFACNNGLEPKYALVTLDETLFAEGDYKITNLRDKTSTTAQFASSACTVGVKLGVKDVAILEITKI